MGASSTTKIRRSGASTAAAFAPVGGSGCGAGAGAGGAGCCAMAVRGSSGPSSSGAQSVAKSQVEAERPSGRSAGAARPFTSNCISCIHLWESTSSFSPQQQPCVDIGGGDTKMPVQEVAQERPRRASAFAGLSQLGERRSRAAAPPSSTLPLPEGRFRWASSCARHTWRPEATQKTRARRRFAAARSPWA